MNTRADEWMKVKDGQTDKQMARRTEESCLARTSLEQAWIVCEFQSDCLTVCVSGNRFVLCLARVFQAFCCCCCCCCFATASELHVQGKANANLTNDRTLSLTFSAVQSSSSSSSLSSSDLDSAGTAASSARWHQTAMLAEHLSSWHLTRHYSCKWRLICAAKKSYLTDCIGLRVSSWYLTHFCLSRVLLICTLFRSL